MTDDYVTNPLSSNIRVATVIFCVYIYMKLPTYAAKTCL